MPLAGGAPFWGEHAAGIIDNIPDADAVHLTFDLCGSPGSGSELNRPLVKYLNENKIPATFFINARFIDANPGTLEELAANPLFRVENHGTEHKPASTSGQSAYGIKGTESEDELVREVMDNAEKMRERTGAASKWFRAGTAYYDERAIEIITKKLGMKIAGFKLALDAGATLPAKEVCERTLKAKPGDILLAHANRPKSDTLKGLKCGLPKLKKRGYKFAPLPD